MEPIWYICSVDAVLGCYCCQCEVHLITLGLQREPLRHKRKLALPQPNRLPSQQHFMLLKLLVNCNFSRCFCFWAVREASSSIGERLNPKSQHLCTYETNNVYIANEISHGSTASKRAHLFVCLVSVFHLPCSALYKGTCSVHTHTAIVQICCIFVSWHPGNESRIFFIIQAQKIFKKKKKL